MTVQFRTAKKWITKRVIPDYTDQLDLFSEASPEPSAPVVRVPVRTPGQSSARTRPEQLGFEIWEPLAPFEPSAPIATGKPPPGSWQRGRNHRAGATSSRRFRGGIIRP